MQNDMRNRLANLLYEAEGQVNNEYPTVEMVADYLIANGVIVPPCKVGDIVWAKGVFTENIYPYKVDNVGLYHAVYHNPKGINNEIDFKEDNIGKTVFLTKEQAEQKLKELSENG